MQQSCLLCISTLLESGNHYSRMFELKDGHTGEPLFETIQISLVCDDCMKTDQCAATSFNCLLLYLCTNTAHVFAAPNFALTNSPSTLRQRSNPAPRV